MKSLQTVAGEYTYNLEDCIGKGAWGSVFKARNGEGQFVALKKMNKFQIQASEDSYTKLVSQIESLQKVKDCESIIRIMDVFKTENYYYIVTEYYEGSEDLLKFMERKDTLFPELEAIGIWKKIIQGIVFLHKNGIVHRDLKPQNLIYIEATRQIKIIDFGLALTLEANQGVSTLVGSPLFISPQVIKKLTYTSKCDIWSLGIIFYYMLFGQSPYGDVKSFKQIEACMDRIKEGQFTLPTRMMSEEVRQLILMCLEYDEDGRPSAAELLSHRVFKDTNYRDVVSKIPRMALFPLM